MINAGPTDLGAAGLGADVGGTVEDGTGRYEGPEGLHRFRVELAAWMDDHDDVLLRRAPATGLTEEAARTRVNQARMWDAGWLRYGWPTSIGGLGGPPIMRAAVAEEAAARGLLSESFFSMTEVLTPTVLASAPDLAATFAAPFLRGDEGWCQGFSEPDSGSDLASLRCRAVDDGDHWVVTGQKIWTSFAQFASRIVLLARTGTIESRHRGITAMFVDMDSPGLSIRPLRGINEEDEFSETFFDGVRVPKDRLIGAEDGGWKVAMSILRSERAGIFWMESAWLVAELHSVLAATSGDASDDEAVGHAFASIAGLRSRSWTTQHRMGAGTISIPETSVDKILMAGAEQELFDLLRLRSGGMLEFEDTDAADVWRSRYMYSRAASIYGGTAEIQRNIVADQLLGLRGDG